MVLKHSERVILWGADPLVTNDIDWLTTLHNGAGYFRALKAKGTKTISINPIATDTAEYLGSEWIAPRPGTDCAMMLGMIHELVRTKKTDEAFLAKCTYGWPELRDYVMGKTDGIEKTPAWAAQECGVPAEKIVELVHDMQSHRTMIMMGWGIQRIQYGEQSHWMGFALAAALGQIGGIAYSNGGTPMAYGPFLGGISSSVKPVKASTLPWKGSKVIPVARFADCFVNPGKVIDFNGTKVTYPEVRLVMWVGGNPFAHQPDTMNPERAWKKPETVIVTATVWTATARHADIVLPAATAFEHADITNIGTYSNDGIVAMQQAIEPQWESKSDYWIFSQLAERLGCQEAFTEGLDEMGWIRRLYGDAQKMGERIGVKLPNFEDFWKTGYVLFDVREKDRKFVAFEDFRKDPKTHSLDTESGLIQLYSPKIAGYKYADCLGHQSYFVPSEGVNTKTQDTPLALMAFDILSAQGRRFPTESLRVFRRLGISSDGFLLLTCASLARRPIHLNCSSGLQFPTGSKALPAPEYVVCGHDVGVALKTALTTAESRLRQTVQRRYVLTLGTSSTRVRRRHGEHLPAEFLHFLIKQAEEDPPSLI